VSPGNQLFVAEIHVPRAISHRLAGLAPAMEAPDLLIEEVSIRIAVAEALALRPDARVNDANDDIFTRSRALFQGGQAAELRPEAVWVIEAKEVRCGRCILTDDLVRADRDHSGLLDHCGSLFGGQFGGKAVITERIIVKFRSATD